jgi:hypothetical protein
MNVNCVFTCCSLQHAGPVLQSQYQLRSREDFEAVTGTKSPAGKRYFKHTRLADIIGAYPLRDGMSDAEVRAWWHCLVSRTLTLYILSAMQSVVTA